jgi:uncharacterized protein with PQ loop repeat
MSKTPKHTKHCTDAQHHLHMRRRLASRKFQLTIIDRLVFVAGPMIPVAIIPTAYAVWGQNETGGIALPTWIILSITSFIMSLYALLHREKALIYTYIPLFFLNLSVVVGVLLKR